ncbi:SprT-like domain-containing protein [Haloterrigena salifodinae]|uniref:SprT-like domain-containing protein n=1 Tax=Haloterrigena salifodinae TaxID=2675099 RepID=A0A8T8E0V1_9EURY|nr:SprT-like domain-containing protein [Haloterrigena salifodinae]QRV15050.1 SprT-like domain-containing protein [Haloterrigena salifodinae]
MTPAELKQAIREYAETVEIDVPLGEVEIEISKQLKRTAGKAIRKNGQLKMRFAWKAYQAWGWDDEFKGTIRHELIHIWEYDTHGKGSHGPVFKTKARELDAPRHCPSFAHEDAKWFLVCPRCGKKTPRFKKSKVVENPEGYKTRCCREQIRVERA